MTSVANLSLSLSNGNSVLVEASQYSTELNVSLEPQLSPLVIIHNYTIFLRWILEIQYRRATPYMQIGIQTVKCK